MLISIAKAIVLLGVLFITIQIVACGGSEPVRYDKRTGSFRFDWTKRKDVTYKRQRVIERQLNRNIQVLQVKLQDNAILEAVQFANKRDRHITARQIDALDKQWRRPGEELPAKLTDKKCNESLKFFQKTFKAFAEIFVTNERGLNVCQTNKTTDYYQADEKWWSQTYKLGKMRHDPPEFDESAGVFAIPVYLPVRDPASGVVIGVAKAIILEQRR